ncbi:MAG: tetratricopeptide repeat protein [Treponema sp.]|jgi:tetratricopeptide (TPR) repeat protein|nr:tetratricopeptide repeat protein [Treponema sp.]
MPSLSALKKFKDSFGDLGREKADVEASGLPYNDLELPDSEPKLLPDAADESPPLDNADSQSLGGDEYNVPPELLSGLSDDIGTGLPDFPDAEASLPSFPDDMGLDLPDFPEENFEAPETAESTEGFPDDPFAVNLGDSDVADGLGDSGLDLGDSGLGLGDEGLDLGDSGLGLGDGGLDLGDSGLGLGDSGLDLGDSGLDLGDSGLDLGDGGLDLGDSGLGLGDGGLDLGDGGLDLGDSGLGLGDSGLDLGDGGLGLGDSGFGGGDESLDLGDSGLDLGDSGLDLGDSGLDLGDSGLDLGDSGLGLSDGGLEEIPSAGTAEPELAGTETDFVTGIPDADLGSETEGASFGEGDFSFPGIDDLFGDSKTKKPEKRSTSKPVTKEDEVEEIHLSDAEMDRFGKTLSGYPLNLRIACEELIVEEAVAPDLMSKLVKMLVNGAPARETAALAGKILDRTILIPRGFEKSTGEAMEAEQSSFAYIFVHNFLPVLRLFSLIAVVVASLGYLIYQFIYKPVSAEKLYKIGYERILAGEYQRANDRFNEAFQLHRKKVWFYRYAEAFRDERQYIFAEQKYDELLRYYQRDKKGVLDYASMETKYLRNYEKADRLLRNELLDYAPNDFEGLLAQGDNSLAWGEVDRSKYEDARFAYARLLDKYGWKDPIVERMMKYFIRTDNLKEVLPLQAYFTDNKKRKLSADSLAELGGYLLDKQLEEQRGVPNEYIEQITGVRDLLLRAKNADPSLPETYYHLSRYYHNLGSDHEEKVTLADAIKAFDAAPEESIRRLNYRIDTHRRYADALIGGKEFFAAEESLVKGISLYEDAIRRRLITRSPEYGRLYASLGDLEYFTKAGHWERALEYYHNSEQNGWAPPEMQYRMGSAYYQLENWKDALTYFFKASADIPLNRRLLFALGNASYMRGDYFASQAYFNRLLDILESERSRLPVLLPNDRPEFLELAERLMMARNNAAVVYESLGKQTGDQRYRSRAMALYAESERAWDSLTRNPASMIRSGSVPFPFLNSRNTLYPQRDYEPKIFVRIDRDVPEPSRWEQLAPVGIFDR